MTVTRENESIQMNAVKNNHQDVSQFTRIPGQFPQETNHVSTYVSDHVSNQMTPKTHVSKHVSHVSTHVIQDQEMTPVTRCLSHLSHQESHQQSHQENHLSHHQTNDQDVESVKVLRECNDALVSFIERARVLSEAQEVHAMFPESL